MKQVETNSDVPAEAVSLPRKLYRYRSCNSPFFWDELEQGVLHRKLYLASGMAQNDPYDIAPHYAPNSLREVNRELRKLKLSKAAITREQYNARTGKRVTPREFKSIVRRMFPNLLARARFERMYAESTMDEMKSKVSIACFSETAHSGPMWAHYAENSRGVCYEYELDWSVDVKEGEIVPLRVRYEHERPQITTIDLLHFVETSRNSSSQADGFRIFEAMIQTKALDWAYEKEWRVHSYDTPGYHLAPRIRLANAIFGANADRGTIEEVASKYGKKISIYRASPSNAAFDYDLVQV